jgi:hypothetical protein
MSGETGTNGTTNEVKPVAGNVAGAEAGKAEGSTTVDSKADGWSDTEYSKLTGRFKNDPKEVAKGLWNSQKEITRLQQELANLKKSGSERTKEENSNESASQTSQKESSKESDKQKEQGAGSEQAKGQESKEDAQAAASLNPKQTLDSAYLEVFESGKISEATIKSFEKMGYDSTDAQLLSEALSEVVQRRMKEAQKQVDTDIKVLKQFAEAEGNFSDAELAAIQNSLNLGQYGVLKDVEKKYKASLKTGVNHGTVSGVTTGDSFAHPNEYYAARRDSKYMLDADYRKEVDDKYRRSNTDNWNEIMLRGR